VATRGKRLPGAGQTQLSNETHVARPGRRIHTAYSGTQLYPEGHRRARILPVPEAIFWYDLTSAQEARPQPTSDEAKGRRHETKAAAGAQAQREETDATLPRGAAPRAHPSSARSNFGMTSPRPKRQGHNPRATRQKGRETRRRQPLGHQPNGKNQFTNGCTRRSEPQVATKLACETTPLPTFL